jgi:hypothetical protein
VSAAVDVAAAQGLRCDDAVVLRDAWHVLVHLRPSPVVARVSSPVPFPEGPDPEDVVREFQVASHASRAGAPVIPPAAGVDPGPHRYGGHVVTFWRHIDQSGDPDPAEAGRGLRAVHGALVDYAGVLPDGHARQTEEMVAALPPSADTELLRAANVAQVEVAGQALHGDAHLMNCLGSPGGALWHDFETACRGPREYDLAALVSRHRVLGDSPQASAALFAYGDHDADLLEAMLPLYVAWVTASMLIALPRRPQLKEAVTARLAWLRRR